MIDERLSIEDALKMSYDEYVKYLFDKYGSVKDDYFRLYYYDIDKIELERIGEDIKIAEQKLGIGITLAVINEYRSYFGLMEDIQSKKKTRLKQVLDWFEIYGEDSQSKENEIYYKALSESIRRGIISKDEFYTILGKQLTKKNKQKLDVLIVPQYSKEDDEQIIRIEAELQKLVELNATTRREIIDEIKGKYKYSSWDGYDRQNSCFLATNWSKGKTSRTDDGLIVHHIGENEEKLLSNKDWCMENWTGLEYQKKENLVYCNYIEHLLLHTKIAIETDGSYGYDGISMILNDITDMANGNITQKWKENCWKAIEPYMKAAISIMDHFDKWLEEYRDKNPECCKCGTTKDTFAGRSLMELNGITHKSHIYDFLSGEILGMSEEPLKVYCKNCFDEENAFYGKLLRIKYQNIEC